MGGETNEIKSTKNKGLTFDQKRILAEFLANLGVAWFAGGIVGPLFVSKNMFESLGSGIWSIIFAVFSLLFALWIVKGGKDELRRFS